MGSGGREHALAWKLAQEAQVFAAPGNPGIAQIAECLSIAANDIAGLRILCKGVQPDLVVVGPEDPLIAGLADSLSGDGFLVFGPRANGARLEASKAFSKELMAQAGVPTARSRICTDAEKAKEFVRELFEAGGMAVVKASGAALGKGVVVCSSVAQAEEAIDMMIVEDGLGEAGRTVVIEERLEGREFSLLTVVAGERFVSLPVAQDYKRALDSDRGPNTGGMGTYSPVEWVSDSLVRKAEEKIVAPTLKLLKEQGVEYRGVLFSGVMIQDSRPFCLEYNVRFGDPETQTVIMRLGPSFAELLYSAARGGSLAAPKILPDAAVTVVLASGGYPGKYEKGKAITLPQNLPDNVQIFHAGTQRLQGQLLTAGGRVLSVSATGPTVADARQSAYRVCESIGFDGMYFRKDIAAESVSA